jgi:2,3-dihydroxyphenylpropionate 1,2-dioxygenase
MQVDHGFAQPLEELTGSLARYPVIPLFINSVAPPVVSFRRARQFGEAVGEFARQQGKRVLFIGSGGLSHNPPVPQMATATPEVAERLIAGRNPTAEARAARQQRTIDAATGFAGGNSPLHPSTPLGRSLHGQPGLPGLGRPRRLRQRRHHRSGRRLGP